MIAMIRQINRVTAVIVLLLLALIVNLSYIQVFKAGDLRSQAGNQRVTLTEYSHERGPILLASQAISESTPTADALKYLREYADGSTFASVTGFYSVVYGATGIESEENSVLAGNDSRFFVDRLQQLFANREPKGGAIRLTIDPAAQIAAMKALNGRTGAVVAIDPATGAILALASSPSFDPNLLSSHDAGDIQANYEKLNADSDQPLLNRPLAMTLPPGSTFKLVTAAAALESGKYVADSQLPGPTEINLPGTDVQLGNWNAKSCGAGDVTTLQAALEISCNTAFAWLGMELGADAIDEQAKKFGFESEFSVPMTSAISRFPIAPNKPQTAMSAIGQFDVRATVLQMAMVVAGIANDGVVMNPYLVSQVLGPDLTVLQNTNPSAFGRAMSIENSRILRDMMVGVVENGTASKARISGISVGGKTGTAENSPGEPAHAWFVGFAPSGQSKVAIAVVLQNGGGASEVSGNALAAPIAAAVMRAILKP
jgi:peptidoglycan glycosyltransferase